MPGENEQMRMFTNQRCNWCGASIEKETFRGRTAWVSTYNRLSVCPNSPHLEHTTNVSNILKMENTERQENMNNDTPNLSDLAITRREIVTDTLNELAGLVSSISDGELELVAFLVNTGLSLEDALDKVNKAGRGRDIRNNF